MPAGGSSAAPRVLIVAHVFYPGMWPELAACIRNVPDADLAVTYVDENAVARARRDFPSARFLPCANRGYDVGPFLRALAETDLSRYDLVVKLHTKRDLVQSRKAVVADTCLNGPRWRNHLLAFVRTPRAWRRTLARFRDPRVGMVADRHVIFGRDAARTDEHRATFDRARALLARDCGLAAGPDAVFVGGTMFAVRAAALRPLVARGCAADAFGPSAGHDRETPAHVMERMLGLAVCAQGLRVAAFNGSVRLRHALHALLRIVWNERISYRRYRICLFGVTVYRRKYPDA